MRVTLWLDGRRPWSELLDGAASAEQAGWDSVRFGDVPGGRECWAVLGALAATVPRVRLEAALHDDEGRHPAVVAKQAGTVDLLSDGRLVLGWTPARDTDAEARLAEACEVVTALTTRDRATFEGHFYRLRDAPLDPKPRRRPLPLLLIGGSAALAARWGDHWSITGPPARVSEQLAALSRACRETGRERAAITVSAWADGPAPPAAYAAAGVDEWVVPDAVVGAHPGTWQEALARIRSATAALTGADRG